jgi:hypothetical protein
VPWSCFVFGYNLECKLRDHHFNCGRSFLQCKDHSLRAHSLNLRALLLLSHAIFHEKSRFHYSRRKLTRSPSRLPYDAWNPRCQFLYMIRPLERSMAASVCKMTSRIASRQVPYLLYSQHLKHFEGQLGILKLARLIACLHQVVFAIQALGYLYTIGFVSTSGPGPNTRYFFLQ